MSIAARSLALVSLLVVGCASLDGRRMKDLSVDQVAEAVRPCVGPYGVHSDVARLGLREGPGTNRLEHVQISASGVVADGFDHELYFDRTREVASVLETGGFAGVSKWYGPVTRGTKCTKEAAHG